jgi:hypothetical protein
VISKDNEPSTLVLVVGCDKVKHDAPNGNNVVISQVFWSFKTADGVFEGVFDGVIDGVTVDVGVLLGVRVFVGVGVLVDVGVGEGHDTVAGT